MSRTPSPCNTTLVEVGTRPASPCAARCKDYSSKLCSVPDSQGTESTSTPESPTLLSPTAAPVVSSLPRSPSRPSTSSGVHGTPLLPATTEPAPKKRCRGEPPKKRRRLEASRVARGFLDLEAEDAEQEPDDDEGSDADAEMNDFLDDTALAGPSDSPSHRRRSRTPDDPNYAQVLRQIAEGIRERARQRIRDAAPPSVVQRLRMLDALAGVPNGQQVRNYVPLDLDPEDLTPIPYLVSMPANARLEQKLIRWLQGSVPGVLSAVSHDLGSGHIYVTALHYACLQLGLEEWPLAWNLSKDHRKPQQLSPLEYQRAMEHLATRQARIESPPEPRPGTWARFATDLVTDTGFITLAGDILVLLGQGLALSVPRIPDGPAVESARDVPQRLCFPASLTQAHPHTKEHIFTDPSRQCWSLGSRRFRDSGLELFAVDDAEVTVDGVEPTDDERELFASSGDEFLCRPSLALPAAALHPGDHVVYRVPGFKYNGGHIQCVSQDDDGVAVATVLPDDGEPPQCVRVPVNQLRLHLLATPRTLSRGDRVLVVGGPHIGTYGHIHEMLGQRMLSIEPSVEGRASPIAVETQQVQVCFRLGDVVEVTRGRDKGVTGLIAATFHGGYVQVYPVQTCRGGANALCKVRTLDVRLVPTETAAAVASASSVVRPDEDAQLRRERDRQREAWEDDMRCMGRLLRGLEVRIVRKHQEKALYGTIVDYRHLKSQPAVDTVPREDMGNSIDSILADVQLQICLEGEGRQAAVTSAQVVERSTGLSVEAAALLKAQKLLHLFASAEDMSDPPLLQADCETDVAWGAHPTSQLPLVPPITVPDIGEETGLWLAHYQLINKRVDVFPVTPQQLEEINLRTPQLKRDRKINGKTAVMSRLDRTRAGYLVPLTEGVPPSKVPGWSVWCKFPPSYNAKMCVITLRPCRQTDVDRQNPVSKCISAVRGRVIIIGPDVDGSHARLGQYAETIPQEDEMPSTIVNVRFPKTRDFSGNVIQPIGRYHLVCLCRAVNSVIPGAEDRCHVTDFEANPP